jgi:rSAM/selenodomain-associated transferase 2
MTMTKPALSVVIPCLNEIDALPGTLDALRRQAGNFEVIIADGYSDDGTWEYLQHQTDIRALQAERSRATQMNAGAQLAQGDWILFLHADTLLPENAIMHICRLGASIHAGGFRQAFTPDDWRLKLVSWLDNFRCRLTNIVYGDQALFVRRRLFETLHGFPEIPQIEDIRFGEQLLKHTRPVLLPMTAVTDARKFLKMGIWRSLGRIFLILVCVELKLPIRGRAFFQNIR